MHPIRVIFPSYTAAVAQTRVHGESGVQFVQKAAKAPDNALRLDNAARALNSFDHAITSTEKLPLQKLLPDLATYRLGYKVAKSAVTLLVSSGAIPGARERVGKQELLAVGEQLHRGVDFYTGDTSRYGRYRALDDVNAALEDAKAGIVMLRKPQLAAPLLKGLTDVGRAIGSRKPVSADQVSAIDKLLSQATTLLDSQIASAHAAPIADSSRMLEEALAQLQSFATPPAAGAA